MPARLLLLCLLFRSSWLAVEGDRHVGAAGVLHRRGGRAAVAVSVGVAVGVPNQQSRVRGSRQRRLLHVARSSSDAWEGETTPVRLKRSRLRRGCFDGPAATSPLPAALISLGRMRSAHRCGVDECVRGEALVGSLELPRLCEAAHRPGKSRLVEGVGWFHLRRRLTAWSLSATQPTSNLKQGFQDARSRLLGERDCRILR